MLSNYVFQHYDMEYVCYTVRSNNMIDEQSRLEIDGFLIFNGIGNVVFVPFRSIHLERHQYKGVF